MRKKLSMIIALALIISAGCASKQTAQTTDKPIVPPTNPDRQYVVTESGTWLIHDMNRPAPEIIQPGDAGGPPSDAIVLFKGDSLDGWTDNRGNPSKWVCRDGYMESVKDSGPIKTKQQFGSCQLHVEFATPSNVQGSSQGRGNSGVFLMDEYEIQVLDSYDNITYPDGQCGALYGRAVPLVNACRKPGEWQAYDVVFHRPTFEDGKVKVKPRFTVFHNGVLIHDNVELEGGTTWRGPHKISDFRPHGDKGSIALQDHGNPVRFRNIWIREIKD
ncbi:MAG: DUF1080 domain-containing protein [Sedimentisphaerales bacterium]|nr:DUF1080 domain-containing protein [Sedimentisphaerales bacterium]